MEILTRTVGTVVGGAIMERVWQVISAFAAVLAVLIAVGTYFLAERGQQLEAVVLSKTSLLNPDIGSARSKLKVTYQGKEIPNVSIIQVRFRNSGRQAIRSADIEEPLEIHLLGVGELISAEIVNPQPPDLAIKAGIRKRSVILSKTLLNPADQFIVEIAGVPAPKEELSVERVTGRIAGVKKIIFESTPPAEPPKMGFYTALSLTVAIAMILSTFMLGFQARTDQGVIGSLRSRIKNLEYEMQAKVQPPLRELAEPIKEEELVDGLKEIEKLVRESRFDAAEDKFKGMRANNLVNFNVLKAFFEFYLLPNNERHRNALDLLLNSEEHFKNDARFYHLLARIFMVMKTVIVPSVAKREACNAAARAIELEPENPKWTKLVGFVHYWFEEIDQAIAVTEKALRLAMTQKNKDETISCKNNLAYYWAMERTEKEKALEYASEVSSHDENNPNYLDSLGFVHLQFAESKEDLRKAVGLFAKALEFAPNDADILQQLKEASRRVQEAEEKV